MVSARAALAIGLALVMGLAGCLSSKGPAPPLETEDPNVVVTREGDTVAADHGAVRGKVLSDAGFPVEGARVILEGTAYSATTNETGEFVFGNVTVGPFNLHVQSEHFQAFSTRIDVRAGETTVVTITLVPPEGRGAGYRPHLHDNWGDKTEIVLMDHDVNPRRACDDYQATSVYSKAFVCVLWAAFVGLNSSFEYPLPDIDGQDPIIYPGTKEIRVTISWDRPADATYQRLGFAFKHANMTAAAAVIALPAKPSGETTVVTLRPDMPDFGHQRWSFWHFFVHAGKVLGDPPDYPIGPIHVKMVIVKGEIAPEPEHRDFWGENKTLTLRTGGNLQQCTIFGRDHPYGCSLLLPAKVLVPPGSVRMRMDLWWNHTTHPAINKDIKLRWRSADQHPSTWTPQMKTATATASGHHFKVYEIPLEVM